MLFLSGNGNFRRVDRNAALRRLKVRNQLPNLLVKPLNGALHDVDFALLKVRLTALAANPSRNRVEHQVITVAVNMEGGARALHSSMTVDAVHYGLLVRKSCSQSFLGGKMRRNDREQIRFRRAYNMDISLVNNVAVQQTAMAANIFRIVLK